MNQIDDSPYQKKSSKNTNKHNKNISIDNDDNSFTNLHALDYYQPSNNSKVPKKSKK